jgi:gliding motility-associated-like protein
MVAGGCTQTEPVSVTLGRPLFVILTPDVCNDPITITATSPDDPSPALFSWTGTGSPNFIGTLTDKTVTANPTVGSAPTYTVEVTPSVGGFCLSKTSITLPIPPPATADFSQSPIDGCADLVTLTPVPANSNAYGYTWYQGATLFSQAMSPTTTTGGPYKVTILNRATGCAKDAAKPVTVNGSVTVKLTSSLACDNAPFMLTATPTPANATFVWSYNNTVIGGQTASTLQDTRAGTYKVTASVGACPATATLPISLAASTAGLLPASMILCPDPANPNPATRSATLDPGPDFDSYDWFKDGSSLGITDQTVTVSTPEEVGKYRVELINKFLCESSDETEIFVDCEPNIVAPTAFRPGSMNGNGFGLENGAFGMMTFFISDDDFGIFIFNRWGEMVYQSDARDFKWNGSFNNQGTLLPAGTYSYVVRYKSDFRPEDGVKEKRGGVVLVR